MNKQKNLLFILAIVTVLALPFMIKPNKSYAISTDTTTFSVSDRKTLQDYVASTAKHYLYKNTYTDYEQHAMDDADTSVNYATFMFRSFVTEPEQLNKTNTANFDCSSFVTNVYMNAFGYSFNDYYSLAPSSNYYFSTEYKYYQLKAGKQYFRYGTLNTGKSVSTYVLEKIATSYVSSTSSGSLYNGNATTSMVPFYYKLTNSESQSKVDEIYSNFESKLQNGDIFVIRYNNNGSASGHTMIYTNDMIDASGNKVSGFIHSTGTDYNFTTPSKGDDAYSVRFMPYEDFKNYNDPNLGYLFATRSSGKVPSAVMLLRPINEVIKSDYTNFYDNTYGSLVTSNNTIARKEMPYLRAEEYASVKIDNQYKTASKYQSAYIGEEIKYTLDLENKSQTDTYTLSVEDTIPNNTTYISCDNNCTYDASSKKITWDNVDITPNESITLSYSLKIDKGVGSTLTNSGMKIKTSSNKPLTMASVKTNINPTYRNEEREKLISTIDQINNAISNGYLTIDSSADIDNYRTKISDLNASNTISMTPTSSLKTIYYNAFDLDIKSISTFNSAVYETVSGGYARKTDGSVDSNNLNPMLVPGLYGGRKVRGNVDKKRTTSLTMDDLEIGDLIIPGLAANSYIFLGENEDTNKYEFIDTDLNITSGTNAKNLLRELFTYNTFVILRPSTVYTSKLNFNYNGGNITNKVNNKLVTIGSKYQDLPKPNKKIEVTLDYNGATSNNNVTSLVANNDLEAWCTDEGLTNKITKDTTVKDSKYQELYAKYNTDRITLPTPTKNGYLFTGWYNNKEAGEKVGNGGDSIVPTENTTLYARYEIVNESTITSDVYDIDQTKQHIKYTVENALYEEFMKNLSIDEEYTLKVFDKANNQITTDFVPTGSTTKVYKNESIVNSYINILYGDVNGDGQLELADIMTVANYVYRNKDLLKNEYQTAADYNQDNEYDLQDIMQLANKVYKDPSITSIKATHLPTKTTYYKGEKFDPKGLEITANYSNGDSKIITDYTYQEPTLDTIGKQELIINYKGKTTKITIDVVEAPTISSIEVIKQPTKTTYYEGDTFDKNGLEVKANYSDGSSKTITDFTYSPEELTTIGTQNITISYQGKTTTISVTVLEKITIPSVSSGVTGTYNKSTASTTNPIKSVKLTTKNYEYTYENFDALTEAEKEVIYSDIKSPYIFTAPHSVPQLREDAIKVSEPYTGELCELLAANTNSVCISRQSYDGTDPNYYLGTIFSELSSNLAIKKNAIFHMDLHGISDDHDFDFAIGTRKGGTLMASKKCVTEKNLAKVLYEEYNVPISVNTYSDNSCSFDGIDYLIVSDGTLQGGKVIQEVEALNNVQLELKKIYRESYQRVATLISSFVRNNFTN